MVWDFCFYVLPLNLLNLNVAAGSPCLYCHNITIFSRFPNFSFIQNKFGIVIYYSYLCRKKNERNMKLNVNIRETSYGAVTVDVP